MVVKHRIDCLHMSCMHIWPCCGSRCPALRTVLLLMVRTALHGPLHGSYAKTSQALCKPVSCPETCNMPTYDVITPLQRGSTCGSTSTARCRRWR